MFDKLSIRAAIGLVVFLVCSLYAGACQVAKQEMSMHYFLAGLVILIIAGFGVYVAVRTRKTEDEAVMPLEQRWFLVGYLLIVGGLLIYILAAGAALDFPESLVSISIAQNPSQQGAASANPQSPTEKVPVLKKVFPQSAGGNLTDLSLTLYGENFDPHATVWVNAKEHPATTIEEGKLISVALQPGDWAGVSSLTVEVQNPPENPQSGQQAQNAQGQNQGATGGGGDNKGGTQGGNASDNKAGTPKPGRISNSVQVPVGKPRVWLRIFFWCFCITREMQLLILVICAGALGSYVHAIRSLTDFIGNRTSKASWFWWYIARPFVGMAMALVFYAVLRGGFLAGTPADAKAVNPFGVIGIGALVGMFSDKAAQKLAEVFDTLFKADDTRKDKLISPSIDKIAPDHVRPGATPPEIVISGAHLSAVEKVRVNQQDRPANFVDDKQVKITLTAQDVAQVGQVSIAVVEKNGTVTSAGTFFVTDLDISPPSGTQGDVLPQAAHGQAYNQAFAGTGGAGKYQFTMLGQVAGLDMNKDGKLTGTPSSPGNFPVNVKVTDDKKASVTKNFKLTVT